MAKKLMAHQFANALCEAIGVDATNVYRVIIDVKVGEAVKVYVQQYGTERLVELVPSIAEGADVRLFQRNENGDPVEVTTAK